MTSMPIFTAEKQFIQIERAKEVLLDKDMREKYDMWRRGSFKLAVSFRKWLDMQPQVHQVRYKYSAFNNYTDCQQTQEPLIETAKGRVMGCKL